MSFLKNLSIGKKIFVSFGIICGLFTITAILMWFSSSAIKVGVDTVKDEILPHTMAFIEIQKDIIQIQQWLTDIAATRAEEGFDDGFDEAEYFYKDAVRLIELELRLHDELGEKEMVSFLGNMKTSLDEYYKMGRKMAQAYVDGGPEKGNQLMEQFDPYAAKLSGMIDTLVEDHKAELHDELESVDGVCAAAMKKFAFIFVATLFVCIVIGGTIARDINKRVSMLKDAFAKAIKGDLTSTVHSDSKDEIGHISDHYNELVDNLNQLISRISISVNDLSGSSEGLSKVSDKMLNESVQTSEKATAVAAATEEMNVNMTGVAATTEQMTTNIQMIVSAAEEMSATIQEIANNTSKGSEITRAAVEQAQDVSGKINKLGDSAKEINKVTETISDISEQTNLLALNATIEAARAGEAGKGFAVVASEIKALAQQTAEATDDINRKISGVQNTTGEAVDAIRHIVSVINDINEIVTTVATSVEEQSATTKEISNNVSQASSGVQEVNENVNQVSAVTSEVAENVSDVSRFAQETNTGSEEVRESAKALSDIASSLNEMIKHFKI